MVRVELLYYTEGGEKLVAMAAKRSILGEQTKDVNMPDEEVEKWILEALRREHWDPWELSWYVFRVENCSATCSQQLIRYKPTAHAQLSQGSGIGVLRGMLSRIVAFVELPCREDDYMCYANALDKFDKKMEREENRVKLQEMREVLEEAFEVPASVKPDEEVYREYIRYLIGVAKFYLVMISRGIPFREAQLILPQATKVGLVYSMSARELATSFFPLEMCSEDREMRELAWKLWHKLKVVHPRLFKYIGPRCVLLENTLRDTPIPLEDYLEERAKIEVTSKCPKQVAKKDVVTCLKNSYNTALGIRY